MLSKAIICSFITHSLSLSLSLSFSLLFQFWLTFCSSSTRLCDFLSNAHFLLLFEFVSTLCFFGLFKWKFDSIFIFRKYDCVSAMIKKRSEKQASDKETTAHEVCSAHFVLRYRVNERINKEWFKDNNTEKRNAFI